MTHTEIMEHLKEVEGVFEVYQIIATFKFYRRAKNGNVQEVHVEIQDAGPGSAPNMRYSCFARAEDGRTATGNPDVSVEMALLHMHWEHLDKAVSGER